ncbi:MAG TPA: carbohydrate ABC transporter permease [Candidatus Nitrosotenuis sp.]|jgi:putative chitobiose transport system permease protein|nr:carbohydrate ABC transporter permease [Candidatus Nitrosotenuis sp.]
MRSLAAYLLLVFLALFTLLPFLMLVRTSLETGDIYRLSSWRDLVPGPPAPGTDRWEAYREVFRRLPDLPRFFLNSALLCILTVAFELVLASLAAYPLARLEFPGKTAIMACLLSTLMLPTQASMIVNFVTIRGLGLFDTLTAVWLPSSVTVFGIFLMRQAFLVIPRDLEDAARIDGCNDFWIWARILVPLSRPALGTLALFAFVSQWNNFLWPLVVLKTRSHFPVTVGLSYMASTFDAQFRLVAAGSVLAMIPILLVFLLLQRQFVGGLTRGAFK